MKKYFCDFCESEITPTNTPNNRGTNEGRLSAKLESKNGNVLRVEVLTGQEPGWNNVIACRYCIIDALNTVYDRPRAAIPYEPKI